MSSNACTTTIEMESRRTPTGKNIVAIKKWIQYAPLVVSNETSSAIKYIE